ncbi:ubiquitin ligase SCF complex subunit Cullin [Chytriomyces sp. MP71]|nr:ubiquitin ligase SCF complex subunit Cullin [Chytriomyces sp. MP71]
MSSSTQGRRGVKPMPKIIKAVSKKNPDQQFETAWTTLSKAIVEIHKKNASVLSFEELYRNAYNMVLYKMGDKLYAGVDDVVSAHLVATAAETLAPAFPSGGSSLSTSGLDRYPTGDDPNSLIVQAGLKGGALLSGGDLFLKTLSRVWDDHTTCMVMIRDILLYMDRVYVRTANKPLVYDLGLDLFRDLVLHSTTLPIRERTIESMLNEILRDREGESIDRFAIKSMTTMLLSLNNINARATSNATASSVSIYDHDFERFFLATTREYYTLEAANLLQTCDARGYLVHVERRLQEEEDNVKAYLSQDTSPKLTLILEDVLIEKNLSAVIEMENSGLVVMLSNNSIVDVARMYRLFSRVETGHPAMRKCISAEIQRLGRNINELHGGVAPSGSEAAGTGGQANPIKWVEALLEVKDRFDRVVEACFGKDKNFVNTVNDALGAVVNANGQSPEFLSLFIDENLKKGQKGRYEADIDAVLDSTVTIFRLLVYKDVFERYYKQHLAKRLLYGKSLSEDAEKNFIGKLKIECGSAFTQKLEGMFTDMKVSEDIMTTFKALPSSRDESIDLSVKVLTTPLWPTFPNYTINYPQILLNLLNRFEKYYLSARHTGRKLTWLNGMGNVDLRANLPKGGKEVNVALFGMIILVSCFNEGAAAQGTPVPYSTIAESTGLVAPELKRALQSLSLGKYRILLKGSKGKDVSDEDTFALNMSFTAPLAKIKILTISASSASSVGGSTGNAMEADSERGETQQKIEDERKHQVEAAIVRTMKSRKRLDHNNLVTEVTTQLRTRFLATPSMIKTRIEGLIEREYLERDAKDRRVYNYLA